MLAAPAQAHCYSIWHYNFPQNCQHVSASRRHVSALDNRKDRKVENEARFVPEQTKIEKIMPLPSLDDVDWSATGDEDTKAILKGIAILRSLANSP